GTMSTRFLLKRTAIIRIYGSTLCGGVLALSICIDAAGQTVTGTGTPGHLPVWTGSNTIGDSVVTQDAQNNIGIGTTNPQSPLHVVAPLGVTFQGDQSAIRHLDSGGNAKFLTGLRNDLPSGSGNFSFYSYGGNWLFHNGNVGIGTPNPIAKLQVG